nr:MAG TPA: hypothetical protein [Caudoviricetes sp.]DAV43401.1 MAG TPA: hypothetical protein [Caudoviricetes sp.]
MLAILKNKLLTITIICDIVITTNKQAPTRKKVDSLILI